MSDDTAKLIRTYFGDDALWVKISELACAESPEGEAAEFTPHSDPVLDGASIEELAEIFGSEPILYIVDEATHQGADHPILCADPETGESFRLPISVAWYAELNLTLGEINFDEALAMVGEDGRFKPAP
ncbi:DUF6924 domain-containing protein [Pseudoprimorskyibacter insulae]|uniref:DUF6924 domain-containing protein n=1 Tax=Pseudoprimorskyibacter insulae TaxID=1695997 RepID=A0A2R8AY72_9RHOB|nr:hypothetical protein [Pseudoprimorskyibacter insulae]SPF80819.1 hypothetical protein PRI8871_02631 [Pseudoprimorskyibacter insulae]